VLGVHQFKIDTMIQKVSFRTVPVCQHMVMKPAFNERMCWHAVH